MRLLIARGGTGGHLFPGGASAVELRARVPDAPAPLDGTERGKRAVFADAAAFRASWKRPKWDVVQK